ncbi:radical SAM protein [Parabacteroides sp. FAFU027]|uniref:radical SAM protein n=1 Tax=Parabacteroides sp. FAFU027 TaxID=2922715 RepID=UPI0021D417F6|nr:radical SAM protein [Parabacteroides sp. FAFU027]
MGPIYKLLKYSKIIKSHRVKSFGIYLLYLLRRRYLAIFFDPVLNCNLRCQMCYFSDSEKRKKMQGIFPKDNLIKLSDALFHRALKLQIGCGAEPSLYKHNQEIILLAKEKGIPFISMTSNGNLLDKKTVKTFIESGLNELTLSLHGVKKETYEHLMTNASYDRFLSILEAVRELKEDYPNFQLRINYTINNSNIDELALFFDKFGHIPINVIQLRPIQKMGETAYADFSIEGIIQKYDQTIGKVINECHKRNITCIAPTLQLLQKDNNNDSMLVESTYCYISPNYIWRNDFDYLNETFEQYSSRTQMNKLLWNEIFRKKSDYISNKRNLNYTVN